MLFKYNNQFSLLSISQQNFVYRKVVILVSNPQTGGPGLCIYILQEEGSTVIPSDTGFPILRFLRLAGLRWRYSNPAPHGKNNNKREVNIPKREYITTKGN
jgi:hypothetical protein